MAKSTVASLSADVAALTAAVAALVAAQAPAPVATPAVAAVEKPSQAFGGLTFTAYVAKRNASRKPCAVESHTPETCNRTFGAGSGGDVDHVAKIVA